MTETIGNGWVSWSGMDCNQVQEGCIQSHLNKYPIINVIDAKELELALKLCGVRSFVKGGAQMASNVNVFVCVVFVKQNNL